jgi:hypothetical protein
LKSSFLCTMMKQLRKRITRLLEKGTITDENERQRLGFLSKTKKWNPYCIRHSAITSDSDYLPEYALKKKVRWSMNLRQGLRYIKRIIIRGLTSLPSSSLLRSTAVSLTKLAFKSCLVVITLTIIFNGSITNIFTATDDILSFLS